MGNLLLLVTIFRIKEVVDFWWNNPTLPKIEKLAHMFYICAVDSQTDSKSLLAIWNIRLTVYFKQKTTWSFLKWEPALWLVWSMDRVLKLKTAGNKKMFKWSMMQWSAHFKKCGQHSLGYFMHEVHSWAHQNVLSKSNLGSSELT